MRRFIEDKISLLEKVFGKEFLNDELRKLEKRPKGKPEELKYLIEPRIHRAAKWYAMLLKMRERRYRFDLRFSAEIEEFMNAIQFTHALHTLLNAKAVSLDDSSFINALKAKKEFESKFFEILVASNYLSNGFNIKFLDIGNKSPSKKTPDILAEKEGLKVYAECKRLRRDEKYLELALKIYNWMRENDMCALIDVVLPKTPKSSRDIDEIFNTITRKLSLSSNTGPTVKVQHLPELLENPLALNLPKAENIEYILATSYLGIFDGILKVREPRVVILRNESKAEETIKKLKKRLREALLQLSNVQGGRKVIYVDISEVAGKPILQLPELIKLKTSPEAILGKIEPFTREWHGRHQVVDSIVLSTRKLYLDPQGLPFSLVLENKSVESYVAPGWTIITKIIPVPNDASPDTLVKLGVEAAKKGNYSLAMTYYRMALSMNPNLKEAYNNIGRILNTVGNPSDALKFLNKALEIDPNYVSALINKGISLALLGDYKAALEAIDKAITLDNNKKEAWYNKALILKIIGQYDDALRCARKAIEIDPNYKIARDLIESLESVLRNKS